MFTRVITGENSQRFVKYQAPLALKYNNLAVASLIDRLEYWFSKKENKFYKFLAPCRHDRYRNQDSWCEELGVTPDVFRRAFKKIGIAYKSYSHYRAAPDKFQGYRYASYYNRQDRQLYFLKNPENQPKSESRLAYATATPSLSLEASSDDPIFSLEFNQHLSEKIQITDFSSSTPNKVVSSHLLHAPVNLTALPYTQSNLFFSSQAMSYPQDKAFFDINAVSRKPCFTVSPTRAFNIYQKRQFISFKEKESVDKFKKRDFIASPPRSPQTPKTDYCLNKHLAQQMIAIWQNVIGDPKLRFIANTLLSRLAEALEQYFEGSLFTWRQYCLKIASSKFLMGESKAWILKDGVYLIWAIQSENIDKVQSNRISTGDRKLTLSASQQALNQERAQIREQIKELETQLEDPRRCVQIKRHQEVIAQVNDLLVQPDDSMLAGYQDAFEAAVNQDPGSAIQQLTEPIQQEIITGGWRTQCRTQKGRSDNPWWHFTSYLVEMLATRHFGQDEATMVSTQTQQITNQLSRLRDRLAALERQYLLACQ